jgi:hypothetical protein
MCNYTGFFYFTVIIIVIIIISKRQQEAYCAKPLPKFLRAFFFLFYYQFYDKGILLKRVIACRVQRECYVYIYVNTYPLHNFLWVNFRG